MAKTKKQRRTSKPSGTSSAAAPKERVNMSEGIRDVLKKNPKASNRDVFEALEKKFGKGSINEASCGVAVSNQRKKLGISKGSSGPSRKTAGPTAQPRNAAASVDLDALKAAKGLLAAVGGDSDAAIAAVRQLSSLQIGG